MTTADRTNNQLTQWSPQPVLVGLSWLLCAVALAYTAFGTAAAGRLLTAIAAVASALLATYGTVVRPRLAVDHQGIVVRRLVGHLRFRWDAVRIRVAHTKRLGRTTSLLELDGLDEHGNEQLVLLGWLDLGTEPEQVAEAIAAFRFSASSPE